MGKSSKLNQPREGVHGTEFRRDPSAVLLVVLSWWNSGRHHLLAMMYGSVPRVLPTIEARLSLWHSELL